MSVYASWPLDNNKLSRLSTSRQVPVKTFLGRKYFGAHRALFLGGTVARAPSGFNKRFKERRTEKGLSHEKIARVVGITKQGVARWDEDTQPRAAKLKTVANLLETTVEWLLTGRGEHNNNSGLLSGATQNHIQRGRLVPQVDADDAIVLSNDQRQLLKSKVHTHFPCSDHAFAVTVFDRSNTPEYRIGDSIVIDPAVKCVPGDMVFASAGDPAEPKIGKLSNATGKLQIVPLNPDWAPIEIDHNDVIGKIVERAQPVGRD